MIDKNLIGIEPDFNKNSNYNPNANVSQVKFGADAPVLEVELNELQQVQDKAREDLVRSTIPSGFTKPVKINFEDSLSSYLLVAEDAEAYVNGMRIFIPKGTKINLGDSPVENTREDLVFLEVWKEEVNSKSTLTQFGGEGQKTIDNNLIDARVGEETSRRVINKWRIRCAQNVNFKSNPDGLRRAGTSFDDASIFAQGGRNTPITKEDSIELFTCLFSQTYTDSVDNSVRNWSHKDIGLYIAGKGAESRDVLKTFDGYSLAIPMFKIHRKPNQGFCKGDCVSLASNVDVEKLRNLLSNDNVGRVSSGDFGFQVKGQTIVNLSSFKKSDRASGGDKLLNFDLKKYHLEPFRNYVLILRNVTSKAKEIYLGNSEGSSVLIPRRPFKEVVKFSISSPETIIDEQACILHIYCSENPIESEKSGIECLLLREEDYLKYSKVGYFEGFKSVGVLKDGKYLTEIKSISSPIEESLLEITTDKPLMGIDENICETVFRDGTVNSNITKGLLNGTESWIPQTIQSTDGKLLSFQFRFSGIIRSKILSQLPFKEYTSDAFCERIDTCGLGLYTGYDNTAEFIYLTLPKSLLETPNKEGLVKYLKANPIEFYYENDTQALAPKLPNGFSDFNNKKGTITKNIGKLTDLGSLDWNIDSQAEQDSKRLRFFLNTVSDKNSIKSADEGNDVFCKKIPTMRYNEVGDPTPRLWCYWGNLIYVDVSCADISCRLEDSNETKVQKFKAWISSIKEPIYYLKSAPNLVKYSLGNAEVKGDLAFTDKTARISNNTIVKPHLLLERMADTNIDLYKGITYLDVAGGAMPSKISVADEVINNAYSKKLTPSENSSDNFVSLEGNTLQNCAKNVKYYTVQYGEIETDGEVITVKSTSNPSGANVLLALDPAFIEPNEEYTFKCFKNDYVKQIIIRDETAEKNLKYQSLVNLFLIVRTSLKCT